MPSESTEMGIPATAQPAAQPQLTTELWAALPLHSGREIPEQKSLLAPGAPTAAPFNCKRVLSSPEEDDCEGTND